MPLAVDATALVVGIACVVAAVLLVLVILAPWRSVRDEGPLDDDVETRLLLGEDPSVIAADLDRRQAAEHAGPDAGPDAASG